jgi:hypothetical protein
MAVSSLFGGMPGSKNDRGNQPLAAKRFMTKN